MIFLKKLRILGLGFKVFSLRQKQLWIYQGGSIYNIFTIPNNIKIKCLKKKIYIWSNNKNQFMFFLKLLRYYKTTNRYKLKGLVEFKKQKPPFFFKFGKKQHR